MNDKMRQVLLYLNLKVPHGLADWVICGWVYSHLGLEMSFHSTCSTHPVRNEKKINKLSKKWNEWLYIKSYLSFLPVGSPPVRIFLLQILVSPNLGSNILLQALMKFRSMVLVIRTCCLFLCPPRPQRFASHTRCWLVFPSRMMLLL